MRILSYSIRNVLEKSVHNGRIKLDTERGSGAIIVETIQSKIAEIYVHDDYCEETNKSTERINYIISESYKRRMSKPKQAITQVRNEATAGGNC